MTPPPTYGLPIGRLAGTRVLVAHIEAARSAVAEALANLGPHETAISRDTAAGIAAAVLTAEDGSRSRGPEYVIALRTPRSDLLVFGRYRTFRAALKVLESGLPLEGRAAVLPICPYPRREPV